MDEECLRPGDVTDQTFLEKLGEIIGKHPHFLSHSVADNSARKTIQRDVSLSTEDIIRLLKIFI